jgi:hypothetical protein
VTWAIAALDRLRELEFQPLSKAQHQFTPS